MKKTLAILTALVMVFAAAAVLAEDAGEMTFSGNVKFNMDMDQVMGLVKDVGMTNPEIEKEKTRGPVEFWELEYEHVTDSEGYTADVKYLFVGNGLVAIHYDFADGTNYDQVKAELVKVYGEAVPFDAAKIGNGKFAIDDDGEVYKCQDMILNKDVTVVLEKDHDGDVEVTFLDPTAAVFNN
jgi:hypothetical protein